MNLHLNWMLNYECFLKRCKQLVITLTRRKKCIASRRFRSCCVLNGSEAAYWNGKPIEVLSWLSQHECECIVFPLRKQRRWKSNSNVRRKQKRQIQIDWMKCDMRNGNATAIGQGLMPCTAVPSVNGISNSILNLPKFVSMGFSRGNVLLIRLSIYGDVWQIDAEQLPLCQIDNEMQSEVACRVR